MLVSAAWGDLTGQWSCDDGGTYYLRQTGRQVNWYGEAAGAQPVWSNVFSGHIHEDRIKGNWTDVPKGRTAGSGDLELLIEKGGDALRVVNNTGGFGGSRWTRLNTGVPITRPLKPLKRSGNEDCIRFNPVTAHVFQTNGRWKIVDGGYWLFDFGSNQAAAEKALLVIKALPHGPHLPNWRAGSVICLSAWPKVEARRVPWLVKRAWPSTRSVSG